MASHFPVEHCVSRPVNVGDRSSRSGSAAWLDSAAAALSNTAFPFSWCFVVFGFCDLQGGPYRSQHGVELIAVQGVIVVGREGSFHLEGKFRGVRSFFTAAATAIPALAGGFGFNLTRLVKAFRMGVASRKKSFGVALAPPPPTAGTVRASRMSSPTDGTTRWQIVPLIVFNVRSTTDASAIRRSALLRLHRASDCQPSVAVFRSCLSWPGRTGRAGIFFRVAPLFRTRSLVSRRDVFGNIQVASVQW